jgi:hypothetical protein
MKSNLVIEEKAAGEIVVYPLGGGDVTTWRNASMAEVIGRYEAQGYSHVQENGKDYLVRRGWVEINEVVK